MSKIFIGKQKENDFNKIIDNMSQKQKEIIEKLTTKFGIFDSEKRKHNLKMLALLYTSYINTLGTIDTIDITSDDFLLVQSLFNEEDNNRCAQFIPIINSFQNINITQQNEKLNKLNKDLYESSMLRLEKKKSDLKNNSKSFKIKKENYKTNKCIFCTETFEENGIENPKLDCNQYVHSKCFIKYITSELNSNHFPIRCPLCTNENRHEINFKIILDCLLLNDKNDLALKLENRSLNYYAQNNTNEVTFCPTPGCSYICFYNKDEFHLKCPLCKKEYCLKCQTEWHQFATCQEYQSQKKEKENDVKFEEYVKGSNFKQCPNCKRWIEKTEGCNNMVCLCGNNFCYGCGKNRCICYGQYEEEDDYNSNYDNNSVQSRSYYNGRSYNDIYYTNNNNQINNYNRGKNNRNNNYNNYSNNRKNEKYNNQIEEENDYDFNYDNNYMQSKSYYNDRSYNDIYYNNNQINNFNRSKNNRNNNYNNNSHTLKNDEYENQIEEEDDYNSNYDNNSMQSKSYYNDRSYSNSYYNNNQINNYNSRRNYRDNNHQNYNYINNSFARSNDKHNDIKFGQNKNNNNLLGKNNNNITFGQNNNNNQFFQFNNNNTNNLFGQNNNNINNTNNLFAQNKNNNNNNEFQ